MVGEADGGPGGGSGGRRGRGRGGRMRMKDVGSLNDTQAHTDRHTSRQSPCVSVPFMASTSFILILPRPPRPFLPPDPPPNPPSASPAFVPVFVFFCDKQIDRQYAY
jgi:hypothetical protein